MLVAVSMQILLDLKYIFMKIAMSKQWHFIGWHRCKTVIIIIDNEKDGKDGSLLL